MYDAPGQTPSTWENAGKPYVVYAVIYDTYSSCAASGCAIVSLEFKLAPSLSCLIGTVQETSAYVKYRGNKLPTVFWWARK